MARGRLTGGKRRASGGQGFTLIELLVVMAIMTALFGIATLSWQSMRARYNVEKQTKEIYMDLENARLSAMQRGRYHFLVFSSSTSPTAYSIFEDGPPPDGDGVFSAATDSLVTTYALLPSYSMVMSSSTMTLIPFPPKGLVDPTKTGSVRIVPTAGGEYDCVLIDQVKSSMGKWNDSTNVCDIK